MVSYDSRQVAVQLLFCGVLFPGSKSYQLIMSSFCMTMLDHTQPSGTRETIASFEWATLPHPPHSLDLAPSDYHLKEVLNDKHNVSDEEMKTVVMKLL